MSKQYDDYLKQHIANVSKGYNWLRTNLSHLLLGGIPDIDRQISEHDRSKYIPDEYDAYLNYLSAQTPQDIKTELEAIFACDYSVLTDKALKGRVFMQENKNSRVQAEKLLSGMEVNGA